jgi:DNA-directed RNA polymerase subunit L
MSDDEDVVMAIKGRWARALGLDDETMSVVALETATRKLVEQVADLKTKLSRQWEREVDL